MGIQAPAEVKYQLISNAIRQERQRKDDEDFAQILEAYQFRGYRKGARSIHMRLLHTGIRMNVKKIRRLMKQNNLFFPIENHSLQITGFSKEITMIDYGITNDTDKFVTEIQIPIQPK